MDNFRGIVGRKLLTDELKDKYINKVAKSVTVINAGYGQGKTYVMNLLIDDLSKNYKEIKIFTNQEDEFILCSSSSKSKELNSIDFSFGIPAFSLGVGVGWENRHSNYDKIRNMLSKHMNKNILICVENISIANSSIRILLSYIIYNIEKLEKEFKKRIFVLITDVYEQDTIYKYNISTEIIKLQDYDINDVKIFLKQRHEIFNFDELNIEKIFELSSGNLHIADFLFEEILVYGNNHLSTLNDIVNKKMALIKMQGEKKELAGKDIENIIYSASLAIKEFSAGLLTEIVEQNITNISSSLEIAKKEALLTQDMKKYYRFISNDIQKHIADMTIINHENWLITYYNYYSENEQDEYYLRAYYLIKYQDEISSISFSLLVLAYSAARKMSDDINTKKVIDLKNLYIKESAENDNFQRIINFYDSLFANKSLSEVKGNYKAVHIDSLELVVKAELTCEYFHYLYTNTKMDDSAYLNVLYQCKEYALQKLKLNVSDIDFVVSIDETILRLKIIYDIAPCILDQLNDYDSFQMLYQKSKELSEIKYNSKRCNLGQYIENVFNRKAFLFVNQAACKIYYEKAKNFFLTNKIWDEYCITLVCEAGTSIVIQQFEEALELCCKVQEICQEQNILLPQINKLYNNQIIAEFLLAEQKTKNINRAISSAKKALVKLKKCVNKTADTAQFVILTNICSLSLYCNNDKQYLKYKHLLEKSYNCKRIDDLEDKNIDDFYRYYFGWFELFRMIHNCEWAKAEQYVKLLKDFVPALFKKQEVFWEKKNSSVQYMIDNKQTTNPFDFCNNLVDTNRNEQTISKFFYRGLMVSDLQYTSYF
ncbi:hypothetical protein [Anaerocolumna chitinilytica]|uniref:Uncharacterized protein n=1 Tax=Anaerocolumna chitinilytica TaxID=1727145 RepID=A0A7I8DKH5_9FIRM|nr:hypothetical protein [Anaerocolumna chitinilytica]BCJ98860.1 hypothetical protein bsdcttw_19010 [Anaerocolumna chitinilytica]